MLPGVVRMLAFYAMTKQAQCFQCRRSGRLSTKSISWPMSPYFTVSSSLCNLVIICRRAWQCRTNGRAHVMLVLAGPCHATLVRGPMSRYEVFGASFAVDVDKFTGEILVDFARHKRLGLCCAARSHKRCTDVPSTLSVSACGM